MINCNYIRINEIVLLGTAIRQRQRRFKNVILQSELHLQQQYQFYLSPFNNIVSLPASQYRNNQRGHILEMCYSEKKSVFAMVRGQIFANQNDTLKALCPYCLINEPKTLDHHVVQSEYPEFSILVQNLIPCCNFCNKTKDIHWRNGASRTIIHFYKDTFLNHRFLYANLIFNSSNSTPRIQYSLNQSNELSSNQFNIIVNHFQILGLLSRYETQANSRLSSEITAIQEYRRLGLDLNIIRTILVGKYQSYIQSHGINYWEGVMYETIEQNINNLINLV